MKIAIDCRYLGMSGMGRVIEGILDNLDYESCEYTLIGDEQKLTDYKGKAHIINFNNHPYSLKGFIKFPSNIVNKLDKFFVPNFLIPLGIKIPTYTIVHDLIFLEYRDSNKSYLDYKLKKMLIKYSVKKAKKIFCVSNTTKKSLAKRFKSTDKKSIVVNPGLSKSIIEYKKQQKEPTKENQLIYVGNVKSHKGIDTLIDAFNVVVEQDKEIKLIIVGEREKFRTGTNFDFDSNEQIIFTGFIEDQEMFEMISKSKFLIQPSKIEGFGITPLEALYLGTKPIISDIDVFKEIYSQMDVEFFKVGDFVDLSKKIKNAGYCENLNSKRLEEDYDYVFMVELMQKEMDIKQHD